MPIRTDLCFEAASLLQKDGKPMRGIRQKEEQIGEMHITSIEVRTKEASSRLKKPKGLYVTAELPHFSTTPVHSKEAVEALSEVIRTLLPKAGTVLVLGVGNREITPDALGPMTADRVLATAHLAEFDRFRRVCVLRPGVLAQTGMELAGLARWIADALEPSCVIAVDALAAADPIRLGCTVQITDTGIAPGSGVQNARKALTFETLGIPVIGIGVPTVVDAVSFLHCMLHETPKCCICDVPSENLTVTPRDVDLMVRRASLFLSGAINCAIQERLSPEELHYLLI